MCVYVYVCFPPPLTAVGVLDARKGLLGQLPQLRVLVLVGVVQHRQLAERGGKSEKRRVSGERSGCLLFFLFFFLLT